MIRAANCNPLLSVIHAVNQEISEGMLSIHRVLDQLNDAQTTALETFQSRAALQLSTDIERLESHLQMITADRAVQFSMEMENN